MLRFDLVPDFKPTVQWPFWTAALILLAVSLFPQRVAAQFAAHNTFGDFGLQAGTQPPPGFYLVAPMYQHYWADTLKDGSGDAVLPEEGDSFKSNAYVLGFIYVSDFEILGAHYSFQIYPALADNVLEIPAFQQFETRTRTGLTDLYLQPINLGWNLERADFTAGFGVYAPTGRYEFLGEANRGFGMWSFEFFGGATVFFDRARTWHLAGVAFLETHTEKRDTDIRVGEVITFEGGLGKSFLDGAISVGAVYYMQWKVTNDRFGNFDIEIPFLDVGKNRVYAIGPELSFPIATEKTLIAIISTRFFWELGARTALEGHNLLVSATFVMPRPRAKH